MLRALTLAFDVVGAVSDLIEAAADVVRWRGDWDRTWSPVSYFLAVFACLVLITLLWLYGLAAWNALRGLPA